MELSSPVSEEENLCLVLAPMPVSWRAAHSVSSVSHGASDSSYRVCVCVCVCVCGEREGNLLLFFCCCCLCMCVYVFFPRGHQHSGSVLGNSSNYLTFAGINNTCAFSGFILIKPFWSGARPEPAPGKAGRKLVAQDGKSGGQLRAGWEGADEAKGPLWRR